MLDEQEFRTIFNGVVDTWNSHDHDITASILRYGKNDYNADIPANVDITKAKNSLDKFG